MTDVSGQLYPVPKEQRKAAAVQALRKLSVPRPDLYMPANPEARLLSLLPESGTPMQSAAKVRFSPPLLKTVPRCPRPPLRCHPDLGALNLDPKP